MLIPQLPRAGVHPLPLISILAALSWLFFVMRGLPGMARQRWTATVAVAIYAAAVILTLAGIALWLLRGG